MKPAVHILATVRKPELLEAALLVFGTLRTGFPDNPVFVWGNSLTPASAAAVARECARVGGVFTNMPPTVHDAWIESLIEESPAPFWICDTDIVFFEPLLLEPVGAAIAGRFEPAFDEEWTETLHMERLHTAVMFIHPQRVRVAMRAYRSRVPAPWGALADFPFIRQHFVPARDGTLMFYDSCAGLWHAGIGTPFTEEQDATFEHLHCATYADLASPHIGDGGLLTLHRAVYANPLLARGLKARHDAYYSSRKPKGTLCHIIQE